MITANNYQKGDYVTIPESGEYEVTFSSATSPNFSIKLDPKQIDGTPGILTQRKWKRKGDLLVDEFTGDFIPLRKLSKEQRKKF